jgi:hypothetical protein
VVAREKGQRGRLGAEQLLGASSSQAEGSTCPAPTTPTCCAASSRPSSRSSRGSKADLSAYTSAQNPVSHSRCLCEARIRIPWHGILQRCTTMEEGTRSVHRDYPSKFSTGKCGWGEASTAGASRREETCSAPASGNETYGAEDTRKTAHPDCVKTGCAYAECTTPRWSQTE